MSRTARHAVITGQVQGVFFRQSAVEKACELGIAGWVRNLGDGSVEAHVEGAQQAVESMVDWLRHGPAHASVDSVEVNEAEPVSAARFEIRR